MKKWGKFLFSMKFIILVIIAIKTYLSGIYVCVCGKEREREGGN